MRVTKAVQLQRRLDEVEDVVRTDRNRRFREDILGEHVEHGIVHIEIPVMQDVWTYVCSCGERIPVTGLQRAAYGVAMR